MESDQKESAIFYVKKHPSGFWDVSKEGTDKTLASFTNLKDAKKYVNDISASGKSPATLMLK